MRMLGAGFKSFRRLVAPKPNFYLQRRSVLQAQHEREQRND